ncbi:MAG: hypothetical protein ACPGSD_15270 [Flavobacteriales bacterium]
MWEHNHTFIPLTPGSHSFKRSSFGRFAMNSDASVIAVYDYEDDRDNSFTDLGKVLVYRLNTSTNMYDTETVYSFPVTIDGIASVYDMSISNDGNSLFFGAISNFDGDPNMPDGGGGAVYHYTYDSATSSWTQKEILVASNRTPANNYGKTVAIDGDATELLITDPLEDTFKENSGAIYFYSR